ncbi:hypothetical protein [Hydrogenophaga sp.]|uniref:hypothetical protein n=1 Tax=Hydrogenophaga sp. TaxID=1904254 RepID=UPI0027360C82|nr:hypothetical protein [Hydrogenophaga sp.]MDP3887705.1 hypothetical protein [Hydrogenophaga sp.]MDZ4261076.1 hypothetical protein [Pseudomonadota bacterium]
MIKETVLLAAIAAAVAGCATTQTPATRSLATATAPVSFDGNVAVSPLTMFLCWYLTPVQRRWA